MGWSVAKTFIADNYEMIDFFLYFLEHQCMQNSRQLGGGWVVPTLYAISIQKQILIILDDPLIFPRLPPSLGVVQSCQYFFLYANSIQGRIHPPTPKLSAILRLLMFQACRGLYMHGICVLGVYIHYQYY